MFRNVSRPDVDIPRGQSMNGCVNSRVRRGVSIDRMHLAFFTLVLIAAYRIRVWSRRHNRIWFCNRLVKQIAVAAGMLPVRSDIRPDGLSVNRMTNASASHETEHRRNSSVGPPSYRSDLRKPMNQRTFVPRISRWPGCAARRLPAG